MNETNRCGADKRVTITTHNSLDNPKQFNIFSHFVIFIENLTFRAGAFHWVTNRKKLPRFARQFNIRRFKQIRDKWINSKVQTI